MTRAPASPLWRVVTQDDLLVGVPFEAVVALVSQPDPHVGWVLIVTPDREFMVKAPFDDLFGEWEAGLLALAVDQRVDVERPAIDLGQVESIVRRVPADEVRKPVASDDRR